MKSKWKPRDHKLVHVKTKKFFRISIASLVILLISTVLRVACIEDSISREEKLLKALKILQDDDDDNDT